LTIQDVPNPRQVYGGWVTDMADLLSPKTEIQIDRKISRLETNNGSEIAVVTVPETVPSATPKQFATELFNYWGIGKKGINNGVLVLISKSDRRIEIETGYGVEYLLPKSFLKTLIDRQIILYFQQGDFDFGTQTAIDNLILALRKPDLSQSAIISTQKENNYQQSKENLLSLVTAVLIPSIVGFLAILFFQATAVQAVEPEGRSRVRQSTKNLKLNCLKCQQAMQKIDSTSLESYLTRPEKTAQKIGSLSFEGWCCPNCQTNLNIQGIHIRTYITFDTGGRKFKNCPNCQELTLETISKITQKPTSKTKGKKLITDKCYCCSYREETFQTIPTLSSDYSGDYDGGGSDFGGGSSGGDGCCSGGW
jgi:uncharacterized protein